MRQLALAATAISLLGCAPHHSASDAHHDTSASLRYLDLTGPLTLSVRQEIEVPRAGEPVRAGRSFVFELTLAADEAAVSVAIDEARASFTAHGQRQRLATRRLIGSAFPLAFREQGRRLDRADGDAAPLIDLGAFPSAGFAVDAALVDSLPLLPADAVAVGSTWTTERQVRSLEGWGWAKGRLVSTHRVTAIDAHDGHTVVSVTTDATAELSPEPADGPDPGGLERSASWTFDATAGRLLSLSIEQHSEGASALPQGEVRHRQRTLIELEAGSVPDARRQG